MNISLTKKPMKPITTNPRAVLEQILLNSTQYKTRLIKDPTDWSARG